MTPIFYASGIEVIKLLIKNGANVNARNIYGETPLDLQSSIDNVKELIKHGAITGKIESYLKYRDLFSKEQQTAFDTYVSLTSKDSDFFQMCLAYQNDQKNNVKINLTEMNII